MTTYPSSSEAPPWKPTVDLAPTESRRAVTPDQLSELYIDEVYRFVSAQMRRREDAEDVVMETFAAAFRDFRRVESATNQSHWLLGIARRKIADFYRQHYRRSEKPLGNDDFVTTPEGYGARAAMAELPEGQREVLILKYVSGLSIEEISGVIRRSPAATNSLLQRGRENLRAALGVTR
ncbi:RNA polymerase sigma factor [bacterium]|nr:MAG: RNA polymerase sigma factor [bacterium]